MGPLQRPDPVAPEAVRAPAPINVLRHMEEDAVRLILNVAVTLPAFRSRHRLQLLLCPKSPADALRIRLPVQLHWEEDVATIL